VPINLSLKANTYIVMWFNSQMDLCEKEFRVERVARPDLAYAVFEEYNRELEAAILKEGMQFPLIVIKNTRSNWAEATIDLKDTGDYTPHADWLVVYGNQRLRILDHWEVDYEIPVLIAESHDEAITIHNFLKLQV